MKPRIVFLQQYPVPYFGILALDSHLRKSGFQSEVVIDSLEKDPVTVIRELNPAFIGISVLSTEHPWLIRVTRLLKESFPEIKIIVGGIHSMLYPREILEETPADFVCHSEGEEVLIRLMKELENSAPRLDAIEGIAYRREGKIFLNEAASLVPFRDDIVEDRSLYYRRYPELAQDTVHRFFSSRGCPFRCSFCYNSYLRELFEGKGTFVRQKSVENFIKEISLECSRHPVKSVFFYDDLFTFNKEWLRRFLSRYKKEIGIPFMCTTRANLIDEETAALLAGAGCRTASFGIETGNSRIRQDILKKAITDEEIIRCGQLLRRHCIKVQTANMFCLPEETLADAFKTIALNIQAGVHCAFSALFLPFPRTELTDYCTQKGYLKKEYSLKDIPHSFLTASVLDLKDKGPIINVHRACYFFVRWPWTFKIFGKLVGLPFLGLFFKGLFLTGNFLRHKEERGISFADAVRYAWRLRRSF